MSGDLRYVKVTEFQVTRFHKEQVGALDVSVYDLPIMKAFKAQNHLQEILPKCGLRNGVFIFFCSFNSLTCVTSITQLHHQAEALRSIIKK